MKKLSFFLMAMLFSVMSFAQEAIYTLDGTITGGSNGYAEASSLTQGNIAWSVTGNTTMSPWRIGGKSITNQDRAVYSKNPLAYNIDKIELTHGTASSITVNSLKLIISDAENGAGETIDVTFKASATTTIDLPEGDYSNKYFKFLYNVTVSDSKNKYVEFKSAKFYAALAEDAVKAPIIKGAEDFISETEVTIEAEDDVTVYYTLDGTEPTTASTVYAAPFTVKETTTVKAVAYRGEKASFVTSATFTQATRVTAAEAAELAMKVASNNALTSVTYVINAYVTSVIDQTLSSGQQRFWVADTKDGGEVLQSYYCNVPQVLKVGDYIQMFGKLTKYNTSPQMKNGDVTIAEEPVIEEPTIECKDALDFGAVAYNAEVAAQTLEVAGYNLTSDITVTLSEGAAFTVDQTTLSAEGGNLVVTPVSPLTVGTHTATLTLASGEATAEVTLTIVAKDVYTITWSVNGETSTTSVVEGDKLVLPTAPEAPEACSEKVFVGWTAAEEVNADGSDIEWVTATTVPTDDATYYAVFALQEGEGSLEEGNVTMKYAGSTTTNMAEGNNAEKVGLDANVWNVTANKGGHNNYPGLNKDGTIRLYRGDDTGTNSIIVSNEAVTIQSVTITCGTLNNVKVLVNGNEVIASNGSYAINASSFVVTNGNTSGTTQVHIASIVINYTSGAAVTYTDYSTTCESEPVIEWIEMELEIANLTTEVMEGDKKYLQLMGRNDMEDADVTLFLNDYADADGDYVVNTETAYLTYGGLELTVIEGVMTQTTDVEKGAIYTGTVRASVTDEEEGGTMYLEFALTMYAAPTTVLVLTDAIVAINEELGTLTFNVATEEGGYYAELAGYTGPGVHEGPQICLFETPEVIAYATYVETEVVDGVITLTGEFISPYGAKFDLTISGKLPVVEPTTITWELNGGEFPAVVVPTNEELAMAFKQEYAEYFAIEGLTDTDMNREVGNFIYVTNSKGGDAVKFITENANWKWLHDYILTVAGNIPEGTNVGYYWRANIDGFFHCKNAVAVGGVASADFTEAGKPEAWGAAYEAEYGVVLPTEPVAEDYVLPTPVKEGYTFVGWYDNADGEGEAMTVLPAGWAGTLYAIWKVEGPATALENIAVEGKAVKAIVNGQLIIIKNGVQYNAQGQVVK